MEKIHDISFESAVTHFKNVNEFNAGVLFYFKIFPYQKFF